MERRTGKPLEAVQLGIPRHVQRAHSRHQHASIDLLTVPRDRVPQTGFLVPARFPQRRSQPHFLRDTVPFGGCPQIVEDFCLLRIHAAPLGISIERERVEMRRDVAGAAGIPVVPPGPADLLAFFENQERVDTGFTKLDRHAESRKTGADDQDIDGFAHRATAPSGTEAFRNAAASAIDCRASGMNG